MLRARPRAERMRMPGTQQNRELSQNVRMPGEESRVNECREVGLCPPLGQEKRWKGEVSRPPSRKTWVSVTQRLRPRVVELLEIRYCCRMAELGDQCIEMGFVAPASKGNSVQFTSGENRHLRRKYLQISINSILPLMPAPS